MVLKCQQNNKKHGEKKETVVYLFILCQAAIINNTHKYSKLSK